MQPSSIPADPTHRLQCLPLEISLDVAQLPSIWRLTRQRPVWSRRSPSHGDLGSSTVRFLAHRVASHLMNGSDRKKLFYIIGLPFGGPSGLHCFFRLVR